MYIAKTNLPPDLYFDRPQMQREDDHAYHTCIHAGDHAYHAGEHAYHAGDHAKKKKNAYHTCIHADQPH